MVLDNKKRIEELRLLISGYNESYYNKFVSEVSDYEYDVLYNELVTLEIQYPQYNSETSPTNTVGAKYKLGFKAIHRTPLLSLQNTYSVKELHEYLASLDGTDEHTVYTAEPKYDGVSLSLIYEDGILVRAATRGDGTCGEDVTEAAGKIKGIPTSLSSKVSVEVRGEVVMPKSVFDRLNEERLKNNKPLMSNPRNAAAGALMLKNADEVKNRGLDFYAFQMLGVPGIETHSEMLDICTSWGYNTAKHTSIKNTVEALQEVIEHYKNDCSDVAIDGVVIKVNNLELQKNIGVRTKTPKWAVAFKYPTETHITRLKEVIWQVGKNGIVTPVAIVEPVTITGTLVSRATLHNFSEIKRRDLRLNDYVRIEKAAEIIPHITSPVIKRRDATVERIVPPSECPSCHEPLEIEQVSGVYIKCVNPKCEAILIAKIKRFVSRDVMNIVGLGDAVVESLVKNKIVKDIDDIYKLREDPNRLLCIDRLGGKNVTKILASIEKSKTVGYARLLSGLNVPYLGRTVSKILVKLYPTIEELFDVSVDDLIKHDNIGRTIANNIVWFFEDPANIDLIKKLKNLGVKLFENSTPVVSGALDNKIFVITGSFEKSRGDIKTFIENAGGVVKSSVSTKTDYLIAGDKAGSKLRKAEECGVTVINYYELITLVQK